MDVVQNLIQYTVPGGAANGGHDLAELKVQQVDDLVQITALLDGGDHIRIDGELGLPVGIEMVDLILDLQIQSRQKQLHRVHGVRCDPQLILQPANRVGKILAVEGLNAAQDVPGQLLHMLVADKGGGGIDLLQRGLIHDVAVLGAEEAPALQPLGVRIGLVDLLQSGYRAAQTDEQGRKRAAAVQRAVQQPLDHMAALQQVQLTAVEGDMVVGAVILVRQADQLGEQLVAIDADVGIGLAQGDAEDVCLQA